MFSFATVDKNGIVTRVLQEARDAYLNGRTDNIITCYYVNDAGHVEFDGSAHTFSASWLAESIGRWTDEGDTIVKWG